MSTEIEPLAAATPPVPMPSGVPGDEPFPGGTAPANGEPLPAPEASNTVFQFQHKVFDVPSAVFRMDRVTGRVGLYMNLGGNEASIELSQISRSFRIETDSDDGKMMNLVERSLRYVREIHPGDSIPNELLDGSASWLIEPRHVERARSKLLVQLVRWMTDGNSVIDEKADVLELINRPEIQEKINDAFGAVSKKLGLPDKQTVISMIEQLANELGYVEALRDKLARYMVVKKKLKDLIVIYRADRRIADNMVRADQLIGPPLSEMREKFTMVDAQTAEVLSSMKRLSATIEFVRGARDRMREFVLLWGDLDEQWLDLRVERGPTAETLALRTYRFAATYYTAAQRWSLGAG
jgi:hypothetical protein